MTAPIPSPITELMKPKILVMCEDTTRKHMCHLRLSKEQYDAIEKILGVDEESVNRLHAQGGQLPLKISDDVLTASQFDWFAPYYEKP